MKIEIKFDVEVDVTGRYIIAPVFLDLYPLGWVQAGKAKEGYRKWEAKRSERRCPCCGQARE